MFTQRVLSGCARTADSLRNQELIGSLYRLPSTFKNIKCCTNPPKNFYSTPCYTTPMHLFLASSLQHTGHSIAAKIASFNLTGRLMFLTTASEVEKGDLSWLAADRAPLEQTGLEVFDFTITDKKINEIELELQSVAVVCVAGGNTHYLLHKMRQSGFDTLITQKVQQGMPYIGSSAGALVAGPSIETSLDDPAIVPDLTDYAGLNLCSISVRPHWGSKSFAHRYHDEYQRLYDLGESMIVLNDANYVEVKDGALRIEHIK